MNKILVAVVLAFCPLCTLAQNPDFSMDADKLFDLVKKTPSYKAQITGSKAADYRLLAARVKKELAAAQSPFSQFYILAQLITPLKDNHLYFYQRPDVAVTAALLKDSSFVSSYRTSAAFKNYPRISINLDSLQTVLKSLPADSVEGIYHYGKLLTAGLYRTAKKDSLAAVVLQSALPNWDAGQIAFILIEDRPHHFRAYRGDIYGQNFSLFPNEKFNHVMLTESYWKKPSDQPDFTNAPKSDLPYQLKNIDSNIQYLRLATFSTNPNNIAKAQEFYQHVRDSLKAPNLIVDLRNNGGGGFKTSQRFINLIKNYKGKVYALVNNRTVSNAEQFTLKLKELKNVTTLGETTNGMLTYGNNYGTQETLPSGRFTLYITDMKDEGNYLPYEGIGVAPDIFLKTDSNWLTQVQAIIAGK